MRTKRWLVFPVLLSVLFACNGGSDSGPMGPGETTPQVAGRYEGIQNTSIDTCSNDPGADDAVVTITQSGRRVSIILTGGSVSGDVQSNGSWQGTGQVTLTEQGITITAIVEMEGSFSGGRFTATQTVRVMAAGDSCSIVRTFDMVRTGS